MQKRAKKFKAPTLVQSETVLKNLPLLRKIFGYSTPVELFKCCGVAPFWKERVVEKPASFWREALMNVRTRQLEYDQLQVELTSRASYEDMKKAQLDNPYSPLAQRRIIVDMECRVCDRDVYYTIETSEGFPPGPLSGLCQACLNHHSRDTLDQVAGDNNLLERVRNAERDLRSKNA